MHRKQAIILLISFKITCLQTNPLLNVLITEKKFFHTINLQLHFLTNKIFSSLNLDQEFKTNTKIQGLLTMHSDLSNIAEKHSSVYDDIQSMTSSKVKEITDLEKLFTDIINEETYKHKKYTCDHSNVTTKISHKEHEFAFVNKLLDKITKLSVKDIITKAKQTHRNVNARSLQSRQKTRDIKVWHPQTSNEDKDNTTRRIYKGKKTRIKKYPFLVSIHVMNEFSCAGSIISKDLVITAATCLQIAHNNSLESSRSIFVRIGSDYTDRHGEVIPVTEIFFHPGFDPAAMKNNIAIIRILKRVKFSKKRKILRIKYDKDGDLTDDDDNSVTILGWGAKDTNKETIQTQKVSIARLNHFDINECRKIYSRYYVTDDNFCAGFESKGGGACNRDVGGPGIVSGELIGIISFGPLVCGMTDAPTVFTKLSVYAKWIDGVIKQKPQTRNTKLTKMPSKVPRAFRMPVLTTPDLPHSVTEKSDDRIGTTEIIYPDEILILREILQEIVLSNNSVIDYILYGDMLATDHGANKIPTTTKKVKVIDHHSLANKSLLLIENQNKQQPRAVKASKIATVDDDSFSNYDEIDTGIKILESIVGFTSFNAKSTTAKARFYVKDNKNRERPTTDNMIDNAGEKPDLKDDQQNVPDDSSSYYEDESGISIEETITTYPSTTNAKKVTEKSYTSIKRINLEDYKNIIFKLNPSRESRGIITVDNKNINHEGERYRYNKNRMWKDKSNTSILDRAQNQNTRKSTKTLKSIKLGDQENVIFNLNPFRDGRDKKQEKYRDGLKTSINKRNTEGNERMESETDDKLLRSQNMETYENFPLGKAMAISDEDFEYDDKRIDKPEYYNNMRSRFDNRKPILWRY